MTPSGYSSTLTRPWTPDDNEHLERSWGWTMVFGVLSMLVGLFMFAQATFATVLSVAVFGWAMIVGAVIQAVQVFRSKSWKIALTQSLIAILYLVAGITVVSRPAEAALTLTLILAVFLMATGLIRVVMSVVLQMRSWGWMLVNGIVTFALGIMIMKQWPVSGLWVIGLFVGIDLIMHGAMLCSFSMAVHNIEHRREIHA